MNGGVEGFLSAEDEWEETASYEVEVDENADDGLNVVTLKETDDFFPMVYGIALNASSRSTEVIWVSKTGQKVLACFPGKALTGRRITPGGPLLARGAATATGSARDADEDDNTSVVIKVDLAFLSLDAMSLSIPL